MAITLNDFKEGGSLRQFVTQIGLLEKIDDPNIDQEELLARLSEGVTISGKEEIAKIDDEEEQDTPVVPDEPGDDEDPDFPSVDEVVEDPADWQYIDSEESWNDSYANGALKDYYAANPSEDLWNTTENRAANYNDRHYVGTINGEAVECNATWASETAQSVVINDETYYTGIFYDFDPKECELFTDIEMTQSAGKTLVITSAYYVNCEPSYQGAVNAPGSTLPWVAIEIPKGFYGTVKCTYKSNNPKYPFGEDYREFNGGYGIVAKNEISTAKSFDASQLSVVLVHTK